MWYLEDKLFDKIPEIFSCYIVEFFLKNYVKFLVNVKYSWIESIAISSLWELISILDPDIKFIFKNVCTVNNFLDVSCSMKNDQLLFDIYHKPTDSFSYLHYHSCNPQHPKNNIQVKQKSSCYDKLIYLLQRLKCSYTHFQAINFFV